MDLPKFPDLTHRGMEPINNWDIVNDMEHDPTFHCEFQIAEIKCQKQHLTPKAK